MDKQAVGSALGLSDLLLVLFVALKLCGVISWSWWWVLSPFWISFGIILSAIAVLGVVYLICLAGEWLGKKTR